jgi:protocatechuate 4,5-dioxygenase alpha chain
MSRYGVLKAMREVIQDEQAYERFKSDPQEFLAGHDLTDEERDALARVDYPELYRVGTHPFLLSNWTIRVWPGDRKALHAEYRQRIAPYGYPDFET